MSIPENKVRKIKHQTPEEDYLDSFVVPESELRALVGDVPFKQIHVFAAHMQVIADSTKQPVTGFARNKLDKAEIEQIKKAAKQDRRTLYQNVVKAILAAVERGGQEGIDLAHRTASYAVQLAFEWTPEYVIALKRYENNLRAIRQRAEIGG